jgi:hypothetical protein
MLACAQNKKTKFSTTDTHKMAAHASTLGGNVNFAKIS